MIDRSLTYSGVVSKTNTMESVWYGEEKKLKRLHLSLKCCRESSSNILRLMRNPFLSESFSAFESIFGIFRKMEYTLWKIV